MTSKNVLDNIILEIAPRKYQQNENLLAGQNA
jgi:hypothetical protein